MDEFEASLHPDPNVQFDLWFGAARVAGVTYPEAMTLATATRDGVPSARMVLLKGHDERGFAFYTNRESRKALELAANPRAALVFHWLVPTPRQVRVEGGVEVADAETSEAYFATRPRGARLAAWASPQSRPVASRAELDQLYDEVVARFEGSDEVPLPPFWGGYIVVPAALEFWEGRENRFHDRVRYESSHDGWTRLRLGP
jgi:pyridoxamine 5'-phosphate oxidase